MLQRILLLRLLLLQVRSAAALGYRRVLLHVEGLLGRGEHEIVELLLRGWRVL